MLSKAVMIESIRQINVSARPDWLRMFDPSALRLYLDHLQRAIEPRGNTWIRPGDTPAIVTRRAEY